MLGITGTPCPMAHPTRNQHIMFSGHKRVHCIKFQVSYHSTFTSLLEYGLSRFSLSCDLVCLKFVFLFFLVCPSSHGLIANMFGPIEGKRHDAFMLGVVIVKNPIPPTRRPKCRSTVSRQLVDSRPTVSRQTADSRPRLHLY